MAADLQRAPELDDRPLRFDEPLAPQFGIKSREFAFIRQASTVSSGPQVPIMISLPRLSCQDKPFHA